MGDAVEQLLQRLGLAPLPPGVALPPGAYGYVGQAGEDTEGSQSFQVANGSPLDVRLSFPARSIIVDNNTSAYVNVPDATKDGSGRWVPPGYPASMPLLGAISRARINWTAPPGKTQPAPIAGETATVVFHASPNPLGFGVASPITPQGRSTAFPLLSRPIGTYTFIPPNLQGIKGLIAYLQITAGAGNAVMSIANSDTTMANGKTDQLLASSAVSGLNGWNLTVYPGIAPVANVAASVILGQTPTIAVVVAAGALTFQVDFDLLQ